MSHTEVINHERLHEALTNIDLSIRLSSICKLMSEGYRDVGKINLEITAAPNGVIRIGLQVCSKHDGGDFIVIYDGVTIYGELSSSPCSSIADSLDEAQRLCDSRNPVSGTE